MDDLPALNLNLPNLILPKAPGFPPRMTLLAPDPSVPSYQPLVMPSAAQMRQSATDALENQEPAAKGQQAKKGQSKSRPSDKESPAQRNETTIITLPGIDVELPVPRAEIISTAVVTAGASSVAAVAGTLVAGHVLKYLQKILKPIMKTALKRLAKLRGKKPAESDAKRRWRQHAHKARRGQNRV